MNTKQLPLQPHGRWNDCPLLPHLDLRQRIRVLAYVRYGVAATMAGGALLAQQVVGIADLDVRAFVALALGLLLCNTVTYLAVRPYHRDHGRAAAASRLLEQVLHFSVKWSGSIPRRGRWEMWRALVWGCILCSL